MKIKNFIKQNKKQAQHVVEFALVLPLFVIVFSFIFQLMAGTYSKHRFTHILTNSIKAAIKTPAIFNSQFDDDARAYNLRDIIKTNIERQLLDGRNTSFTNIEIGTIETNNITFIIGAFQYTAQTLFLGRIGKEYFQFFVPVGTAYLSPVSLNLSNQSVENYFKWYYATFYTKFYGAH